MIGEFAETSDGELCKQVPSGIRIAEADRTVANLLRLDDLAHPIGQLSPVVLSVLCVQKGCRTQMLPCWCLLSTYLRSRYLKEI